MTIQEVLQWNIDRLTTFYGESERIILKDKGFLEFFRQYDRILDWHGAPSMNLSFAYFDSKTYDQFLVWLGLGISVDCIFIGFMGESNEVPITRFKIDGYHWVVNVKNIPEPINAEA